MFSTSDRETAFVDQYAAALRAIGVALVIASLATSLFLVSRHTHLGASGDQLAYYDQAGKLLPFTHTYYGPGYFVALRVVHDLFRVEWFTAGRLLSWLSACVFLALCHLLFRRLVNTPWNWLALGLVAANPTFITYSYSSQTFAFGSMWVVAAIVVTIYTHGKSSYMWFVSGLVFGVAFLSRFQAMGFFLGALVGMALKLDQPAASRCRIIALSLGGFVALVAPWYLFLQWYQGFIPANHNFVHLTLALGKFKTFHEVNGLISEYGSMLGVLRADGAITAIVTMAIKEGLKFPFVTGFPLFFLAAGWLIPGLVATATTRVALAPWFFAFLFGLVLTGLGARGWLSYYFAVLPFAALLIANGVHAVARTDVSRLAMTQTVLLLASTLLWSPFMVQRSFLDIDWPEWSAARAYLQARARPDDLISSAATSFPYGTTLRFVDRNDLISPGQETELLPRLRARGVTYLVLSEREWLQDFPSFQSLLGDSPPALPEGFVRELLITTPRRLAIYRISDPECERQSALSGLINPGCKNARAR